MITILIAKKSSQHSPQRVGNIENIDKNHPLGKPDKEGRQLRIVKFISDSFKETITDDTSTALKPMLPIRERRNWLLELTSNSNHLSPAKD